MALPWGVVAPVPLCHLQVARGKGDLLRSLCAGSSEVYPGRPTHRFLPLLVCWTFKSWSGTARDTGKCSPQLGPARSLVTRYWGQPAVWALLAPGKLPRGPEVVSLSCQVAGLPGGSQSFRQADGQEGSVVPAGGHAGPSTRVQDGPGPHHVPAGLRSCSHPASAHPGVFPRKGIGLLSKLSWSVTKNQAAGVWRTFFSRRPTGGKV